MYRKIDDFIKEWKQNCAGTIAIMESITEEKNIFLSLKATIP